MSVPADKVVLASALVTLTSTTAASVLPKTLGGQGSLPSPRLLFGTSLTFVGVSMLADFVPGVAVPLATVIGFTALTYYGIPLLDNWMNGKHNKIGKVH